jgi:hypothetical protein
MFRMSRYHSLIGRRVEVQYRAGDVILPATGTLAADSGRSIFLEERLILRGQVKTFRWEIPYAFILSLDESFAPLPASTTADENLSNDRANAKAAGANLAPLRSRPNEA